MKLKFRAGARHIYHPAPPQLAAGCRQSSIVEATARDGAEDCPRGAAAAATPRKIIIQVVFIIIEHNSLLANEYFNAAGRPAASRWGR